MLADPNLFSEAVFGLTLWRLQRDIANCVIRGEYIGLDNPRYTAVRSGHAVGKSAIASLIALEYLQRPDSIVITTAPTWRQVCEISWKEISILVSKGQRPIQLPSGMLIKVFDPARLNITKYSYDRDWYAMGISTNKKESFQGIHAPGGVLVVADEASGVEDEIFEAIEGNLTGQHDKFLGIGNPTRSVGWFFNVFHDHKFGQGWAKFHIDCEKTPWISKGLPPPAPGLCSQEWIDSMVAKWGRDHPLFKVRVNGEFDTRMDRLLLSLAEIEAAMTPERYEETREGNPVAWGWDIGWKGDMSVGIRMSGDRMTHIEKVHHKNPMEVAGIAARCFRENPSDVIAVDAIGLGAGVYSRLMELNLPAIAYEASASPDDPTEYINLRAESYDHLAIAIKNKALYLLEDEDLKGQLCYQPTDTDSAGRLKIWSKDDMRSEKRSSPDVADSAVICRWGQRQANIRIRGGGPRIIQPDHPGVFTFG